MNVYFHHFTFIEHVIVWTYFLHLYHLCYIWFEFGPSTHRGMQLVRVDIDSSCSTFSPFFKFCKFMNGLLPALTVQRLGCFGWILIHGLLSILICMHFLVHGLDKYASSFISSIVQTNVPQAYFSLLYPYFKESLIDVTSLRLEILLILSLSLLVVEIMQIRFIHHIHWKSKLHIHNINIVHKYGTCLEANAFQGIINTIK